MQQSPEPSKRHSAVTHFPSATIERWRRFRPRMPIVRSIGRNKEFLTTREGSRLATSNGGVLSGRGADIILIDDPLKPEEALSDTQRQAANDWFSHTLHSRLNDKRTGAIVIIMQRLHEDDLVGTSNPPPPWTAAG